MAFAVAVPALLMAQGYGYTPASWVPRLSSPIQKESRKHQDIDLVCTADPLGAQFGLCSPVCSTQLIDKASWGGCLTEHPCFVVGAVPYQAQPATGEPW